MSKQGDMLTLGEELEQSAFSLSDFRKDGKQVDVVKALHEKRQYISKANDWLHIAEREADRNSDEFAKLGCARGWEEFRNKRHLIAENAVAYCN